MAGPAIVCCLLAATAAGPLSPLPPTAILDPLRAASLPLEGQDANAPPEGRWQLGFSLAYFNLWQGSRQVPALHRELGRRREAVGSDELRELVRRYPDTDLYHLDLEGWRADLVASLGLPRGLSVTVRVPWIVTGSPHWDGVGEAWHSALGMAGGDRELFPRGSTLLWARIAGETIERREELRGSGISDLAVSLGVPLGTAASGQHRLVVAVEAPTGKRGTLRGSGGWDAGLRYFATWQWARRSLLVGAGYTVLDGGGTVLGLPRRDTWHALVQLRQRLGRGISAFAGLAGDDSPFAGRPDNALGDTAVTLRLGLLGRLGTAQWLSLQLDQDFYGQGISPDYAFRLSWGTTTSGR